jgi:heme o synthase
VHVANILSDYLTLCKPKVVLLMLITSWVGMYLANPNTLLWYKYIYATLGIASMASAAAMLNHVLDRKIDVNMSRTASRPIPTGKVKSEHALLGAAILASIGWLLLSKLINTLTCVLTFATLIGYAGIYTIYLKRATPQNIVIGGLSGAMPPLLGWCSIAGTTSPESWLLVLIIFVWTPPHFWALAISRVDDYSKVAIPMLPVTHGIKFTKLNLLLYTLLLLVVTSLPFITNMTGIIYFATALVLNVIFIGYALRIMYCTDQRTEHILAIKMFKYSITYLFVLFSVLVIDYVPISVMQG